MSSGSQGKKACSICGSTYPHMPLGPNSCEWDLRRIKVAQNKHNTIEELVTEVGILSDQKMMLRNALKPFAEDGECGYGFTVGEDEDHTKNCHECKCILAARKALEIS